MGLPFVPVEELPGAVARVGGGLQVNFLRDHLVYPLRVDESGLMVAMARPDDVFVVWRWNWQRA